MMGLFSSGSAAFEPKNIPDLSGKVIIITGANGGLGYETVLHLAAHRPSRIYLCARSQAKYDQAMEGIGARVSNAAEFVSYLQLDLGSLASIRAAARTFLADNHRLHILMNNAGIMAHPPGLTSEGYEIQFGTNHLGHFLFTRELLPIMRSTAAAGATADGAAPGDSDVRIINVSSEGHRFAPRNGGFLPDACTTDMREYSTWTRYGQSKLANILFTAELARRYPDITSVAIHPGTVLTSLSDPLLQGYPRWLLFPARLLLAYVLPPPSHGALNQTWASIAPVKGKPAAGVGGGGGSDKEVEQAGYYVPVAKRAEPSRWAMDEELSTRLWEWSEKELQRQGYD